MIQTKRAYGGMVVAPHHLAAEAGLAVLREGGNAIEAMIAAASMIAVVYPHMNGLGGDNVWLIHTPGRAPVAIDACGAAAESADITFYRSRGLDAIPGRGPLSALTVAGAVSGWQAAFEHSQNVWRGALTLPRLLEDAIGAARNGTPVTASLAENTRAKSRELRDQPGFAGAYLTDDAPPAEGARLYQNRIADTLEVLAQSGLQDFYCGDIAAALATDLESLGSPIRNVDLAGHRALLVEPLRLEVAGNQLFNMPPPTQGLASLLMLGIYDRLGIAEAETFEYVHGLVEAAKCAFRVRDRHVGDPSYMMTEASTLLDAALLDEMAGSIDRTTAAPWPDGGGHGDTVWLGAVDRGGRAVSFIQSIYWEFGSGVVLPQTGITWQNRGTSFSLTEGGNNSLIPRRRPFHTIQPALAHLADGRVMPYGTMGGEGQPQTQAMIFSRHVMHGQSLQQAITAPRWLLGRTWGSEATNLRIENRFEQHVYDRLLAAGHDVEIVGPMEEVMGHAGALVHHPDGLIEGASDPRCDGAASGF